MLRRTIATLAAAGILLVAAAPGVTAQDSSSSGGDYAGGAQASALTLEILGQELALSFTQAGVASTPEPTAAANGAAALLVGSPVPGDAPVTATSGQSDTNEVCPLDLTPVTDLLAGSGLTIDIACVRTAAAVDGGNPSASSSSGEVVIELNGLTAGLVGVLGPVLEGLLTPLLETTSGLVDQLCDVLLGQIGLCGPGGIIDLDALVDELVGRLLDITNPDLTIARVRVAPTVSEVAATADQVTAAAAGGLVTVEVLPGLGETLDALLGGDFAGGEGILSVSIAPTAATVTADRTTGETSFEGSRAALLSVDVPESLGILHELLTDLVPGLLDSLLDNLDGLLNCDSGVLADILCVELGGNPDVLDEAELEAYGLNFGEGTLGVAVAPARIEVLGLLGDPLLALALSESVAAANAVPAQVPPTTETPEQPPTLPRTGGSTGLPIAFGLFLAAGLGVAAVRRASLTR